MAINFMDETGILCKRIGFMVYIIMLNGYERIFLYNNIFILLIDF